jgi:tetratricopeptide (TPR) repeat protein
MGLHTLFHQVRADLSEAAAAGHLTDAAAILGELGHTGASRTLPADRSAADALLRLAWLLFVRAPSLDGRYVVLGPVQVGELQAGRRTPVEVLDELAKLEQVAGGDTADLDRLLAARGEALAALVAGRIGAAGAAGRHIAAFAEQARVMARDAAVEGRWDDVPLEGPDAPAIRAALRFLPAGAGVEVLDRWAAAQLAAEAEQWDQARAELDAAAARAPDLFETYVRRAKIRSASNDRFGAAGDVERAIALNPSATTPRAMRGELRMIARDLPGSMQDWDLAVRGAPDHAPFRLGRGYTRLAAGRNADAIADLREAVHLAPDDPSARFSLADVLVRVQELRGAIEVYTEILARWPDSDQARLNRGTARLMSGDPTGAAEDLSALLESRPGEPVAWLRRAVAWLRSGRPWPAWLDALTAIAWAPEEWPHESNATQMLLAAHRAFGPNDRPRADEVAARLDLVRRRATAREITRFVEQLGTHLPAEGAPWHMLRAEAWLLLGKGAEAVRAAEDALAVDTELGAAHLARGRALLAVGEAAPALQSLDLAAARAWDLDATGTFELHLARARALGTLGQLPEAIAAFDEALGLRPDRADVWFYRGVHLDLAGHREDAEVSYTASIERNPAFAPAWFNRACERAVLGRADGALADLQQAIVLDPKWAAEAAGEAYFDSLRGDPRFPAAG